MGQQASRQRKPQPVAGTFVTIAALLFLVSAGHGRVAAAEIAPDTIAPLLQRPVLGGQLALQQAQRFCEARVPRMPPINTAQQWDAEAQRLRAAVLDQIVFRGQAAAWRDATTRTEWLETIPGGEGYRIKKLRFEALPGMWIPALLYEPDQLDGRVPVVLNVNGHSPEGKAYNPKQVRCINQARRGMLALNVEWVGMGQLRTPGFNHGAMNQLDLCGASGLAPFYLSMKRALDVLLSLDHADPDRVAVTGLSGGGWQTIFFSALETRVKLAVPVAGYSSFLTRTQHHKDLGDSEQTPNDLATLVDYTHLTAMMAPRPTLLTFNAADDCCFESGYALGPLLSAAHPVFCLHGQAAALRSHINYEPGTHNYERENREALYQMLGDFFFSGDPTYECGELACQDELKSADTLAVTLPDTNEDFQTLATQLASQLPLAADLPTTREEAEQWQKHARARLVELTHATHYEVVAREEAAESKDELTSRCWQLQMNDEWTVPAVELALPGAERIALVLVDGGRATAAPQISELIGHGWRVVVVDPFCLGESDPGPGKPPTGIGTLFALTVAAVGERPLGIQASQSAAAARWLAQQYPAAPITLVAFGPRTSLIGLVAAGLEPRAIHYVRLHESLGSLKQVIENNWSARETPEFFCYGLLQAFDIRHLSALVAPRQIDFPDADERVRGELNTLHDWYQLWDVPWSVAPGTN